MKTLVLITLAVIVLYVAFRFFKGTANSSCRSEDTNWLPGNDANGDDNSTDAAGYESDNGSDTGGDSGNDSNGDTGGDSGGSSD